MDRFLIHYQRRPSLLSKTLGLGICIRFLILVDTISMNSSYLRRFFSFRRNLCHLVMSLGRGTESSSIGDEIVHHPRRPFVLCRVTFVALFFFVALDWNRLTFSCLLALQMLAFLYCGDSFHVSRHDCSVIIFVGDANAQKEVVVFFALWWWICEKDEWHDTNTNQKLNTARAFKLERSTSYVMSFHDIWTWKEVVS